MFYKYFMKYKLIDFLKKAQIVQFVAIICAIIFYASNALFVLPPGNSSYKALFYLSDVTMLEGKVVYNPAKMGSSYSFYLSLSSVSKKKLLSSAEGVVKCSIKSNLAEAFLPGKLYSLSRGSDILLESGEELRVYGRFEESKGIFNVESASLVDNVENKKKIGIRALCRLEFRRLLYSWGNAGELIFALIAGVKDFSQNNLNEIFKRAGLSYILALSGMHLSFFSHITGSFTSSAFGKRYGVLGSSVGVLFFIWFAGLSPSLTRAFLCFAISQISSILFCKRSNMFSVLCLSFIIQSIFFTSDVYSIAFMLSYGSMAGIILFQSKIEAFFCRFIPPLLAKILSAPISAQVFTVPLCAYFFRMVAPIGIVSSIFMGPLISVFFALSIVFICISLLIPAFSNVLGCILNVAYDILIEMVKAFASFPPILL